MKPAAWLILFCIGIGVAIAGGTLCAYQEENFIGSYGIYTITKIVNPYQGLGIGLIIVGAILSILTMIMYFRTRTSLSGIEPPPPPPPPPSNQ